MIDLQEKRMQPGRGVLALQNDDVTLVERLIFEIIELLMPVLNEGVLQIPPYPQCWTNVRSMACCARRGGSEVFIGHGLLCTVSREQTQQSWDPFLTPQSG
jgi:hypothetical protein